MVMMMMMMMMIINKNRDRCGNTNGEKRHEKGRTKAIKMQRLCAEIQKNVEPAMHDRTGNNWSHRHSKKSG